MRWQIELKEHCHHHLLTCRGPHQLFQAEEIQAIKVAQDPYRMVIPRNRLGEICMQCPCSKKQDFDQEPEERLKQYRSFLDNNFLLMDILRGCCC